jgi:Asp-tRNA(Asn)/Glu-tRNA(Gln) amidotransferase A subunit family amidase
MSVSFARRGVAATAAAINSGETSALAVMEETLARIAAYDAVQPQAWISRADPRRCAKPRVRWTPASRRAKRCRWRACPSR